MKAWTMQVDQGGVVHVSNDAFHFFCAVEEVTYYMLKKDQQKKHPSLQCISKMSVCMYVPLNEE